MRLLRELLLWAGAVLGLLAVAAGLAVALGGFGFLIFRSGSMEPEIPTGGIALSRTVQAGDIRTGDVVSVIAANGERVTHRVVSSTLRGDETTLVLKGDANSSEDSELYVVTSAERVVASVPIGGYVVAHALTPPGLVALGSLSLMLIALTGGRREEDEGDEEDGVDENDDDRTSAPRSSRHRADVPRIKTATSGLLALVVIGGAGASALSTNGTLAFFTDDNSADTSTFSSTSIALPVAPAVTTGPGSAATITWTATAVGSGALRAASYDVLRYSVEANGVATPVCTAATALSCTDSSSVTGTAYYAIRARFGNWFREGSRTAYTPLSPPTNVRCGGGLLGLIGSSVQWGAPTTGSPTGYRLNYSSPDGADVINYGPTVRQGRPPNPPNGFNRTYTVTVSSVLGSLVSAPSTPVTIYGRSTGGGVTWSCV